jgi:hypothetical protein
MRSGEANLLCAADMGDDGASSSACFLWRAFCPRFRASELHTCVHAVASALC